MTALNRRTMVKSLLSGLVLGSAALTAAAAPPAPPVSITLCSRDGKAWPKRQGFAHTGGGNIDVQQPSPDVLTITLTGVAVAGAHPFQTSIAQMAHEVCQEIEVSFDDPKVKKAKITLEGRVTGLLRSHKKGGLASISAATASVGSAGVDQLSIAAPTHTVNNGINLSVNDLCACQSMPVPQAGAYTVRGHLCISATHPRGICPSKASSAEFAPDPALDPLWISYWEPFHGAAKKDFGFQITVKVSDDSASAPAVLVKPVSISKPKTK